MTLTQNDIMIFHFHEESFPLTPITMLNTCNSMARVCNDANFGQPPSTTTALQDPRNGLMSGAVMQYPFI
jgi:hypothetical protein